MKFRVYFKVVIALAVISYIGLAVTGCCQRKEEDIKVTFHVVKDMEPTTAAPPAPPEQVKTPPTGVKPPLQQEPDSGAGKEPVRQPPVVLENTENLDPYDLAWKLIEKAEQLQNKASDLNGMDEDPGAAKQRISFLRQALAHLGEARKIMKSNPGSVSENERYEMHMAGAQVAFWIFLDLDQFKQAHDVLEQFVDTPVPRSLDKENRFGRENFIREGMFLTTKFQGDLERTLQIGRSILEDERVPAEEKIGILMEMKEAVYDLGPPPMSIKFEKQGYEMIKSMDLPYAVKAEALMIYIQDSVERNVDLGRGDYCLKMLAAARKECSTIFLDPEVRNEFVRQIYKFEKQVGRHFSQR